MYVYSDLIINGEFACYTLELPWRKNANDISCIPIGKYRGFIRNDIRKQGIKGFKIQLKGVPDRVGIQIHIGNWPHQTEGCILVGTTRANNMVGKSADALRILKNRFKNIVVRRNEQLARQRIESGAENDEKIISAGLVCAPKARMTYTDAAPEITISIKGPVPTHTSPDFLKYIEEYAEKFRGESKEDFLEYLQKKMRTS